jgi:hypothetical protein
VTPLHEQIAAALKWLLTREQTQVVAEVVATLKDALASTV